MVLSAEELAELTRYERWVEVRHEDPGCSNFSVVYPYAAPGIHTGMWFHCPTNTVRCGDVLLCDEALAWTGLVIPGDYLIPGYQLKDEVNASSEVVERMWSNATGRVIRLYENTEVG